MSNFFQNDISVEQLNKRCQNTMAGWIGLEFTEVGDSFVKAKMPIDHRTTQPLGLVNGGAYCTMAEVLGSVGANFCIDRTKNIALGLDINANYIYAAKEGWVYGIANPIHVGRSSQVWEIKISDDNGRLCCVSRLTVAIIPSDKNVR